MRKTFLLLLLAFLLVFSTGCPGKPKELPQIQIRQEDILVSVKPNYIATQCYATNKSSKDWEGSAMLTLEDEKGGPIYSSLSASWPSVTLKPGERNYLAHRIPIEKIAWALPHIEAIKVVWRWGGVRAEKVISMKRK